MFDLRADYTQIPNIKFSYNIGALLDIPTGTYLIGIHGESILNGGLGNITGVVGIGNNFKSTIMHFMLLSAMSKFTKSTASTYDTEINISEARLKQLAFAFPELEVDGQDIVDSGRWQVTDKTVYHGNEFFEKLKKYMASKIENSKSITVITPFLDRAGKIQVTMLVPTFTEIDSLTKFDTQSSNTMQEENELGDSGANTLYMKEGQAKKRMISYLPKPVQQSNNYMLISAHVGKTIPMDPRAPPVKKLQFLKNNDTLKGVTDDFTFLTTNCWQCQNATPLFNDTTKGPEYPRDTSDNMRGDTDLFLVTLIQLRSKTGVTGLVLQLIISQRDGVLPSLSEFHYVKINDRYGLGGNMQNYYLELMPEIKLSRTTVRGKLDHNEKLKRAINITAEMCQMTYLWHDMDKDLLCTPKELYEDLIKLGFNWDTLLSTRGWWTYDNDKHKVPFLSTLDLLKMRKQTYFPFWMNPDKTINEKFILKDK